MKSHRTAAALALAAFALVIAGAVALRAIADGDRTATSAGAIEAFGDDPRVATEGTIAFFAERLQRDPLDFISATRLGAAYIRQARETGDVGGYSRAEAALRVALRLRPDHTPAQAYMATVLLAQHDFPAAADLARTAYDADPSATQALAILGDALLELGEYDEARATYQQLAIVAPGPAALARLAHIAELEGRTRDALDLMTEAERRISERMFSPESIAWHRLQLGEMNFMTGDVDEAERWYRSSLGAFPDYPAALGGLARVAAARGDDAGAIALYEQAVAITPVPALLAQLGDVYARAGNDAAAARQYDTVELIGRLAEINRTIYNRDLALFRADHGRDTASAVELALGELEVRRDIYGYDAVAWALYADGRAAEAVPYVEQALRLGAKDPRLLFHAGMVFVEGGDEERGQRYLEEALSANPHFSVLSAQTARDTLASLRAGDDALARQGGAR